MNGKKAKEIRKQACGDYSHRFRRYVKHQKTGAISDIGPRGRYQKAKKRYKAMKRRQQS